MIAPGNEERDTAPEAATGSGVERHSFWPRSGLGRHFAEHRLRWGLVGVGVIGGGAAALILTLTAAPRSRPFPSTGYVLSAARHSLADQNHGVVELSTIVSNGNPNVSWFNLANNDVRTDSYRNGQLQFTSYLVDKHQVNVDYAMKTWSSTPPGSVIIGGFGLTREGIEHALANGTFTLVGPESVAGEETLVLTGTSGSDNERLWIDKTTYLPILQTLSAGQQVITTTKYSWYPAAAAMLKRFVVTIPPGFTQTASRPTISGTTGQAPAINAVSSSGTK